jgi:hypothetical protein
MMSTGYEHIDKQRLSFESIDLAVAAFNALSPASESAVQNLETRAQQLVTVYASVRPILFALEQILLIPAAWRAVLKVFITTLDDVSASFKAGKDLATGPVGGAPKADMEPKLPVG